MGLAKQGLKRRLALTLPQMYAGPMLVARSDMIATVMGGVVAASGHADKLCVLEPPLDLDPMPFVISWHRRSADAAIASPPCRPSRAEPEGGWSLIVSGRRSDQAPAS